MIKRLFLAPLLFAAALAAGCMTLPGYEPGFRIEAPKGERLVVLVTATWRTANDSGIDGAEQADKLNRKVYKERYGIDVPEDWELVQARGGIKPISGVYNLFAFFLPKKWQVEPGDYVEIESQGPDRPAKAIRVVTRWDDPRPGGCYWPHRSANPDLTFTPFSVICRDNDPEAPKYRKAIKKSLLSFPVNTKPLPPEDRAKAVDQ